MRFPVPHTLPHPHFGAHGYGQDDGSGAAASPTSSSGSMSDSTSTSSMMVMGGTALALLAGGFLGHHFGHTAIGAVVGGVAGYLGLSAIAGSQLAAQAAASGGQLDSGQQAQTPAPAQASSGYGSYYMTGQNGFGSLGEMRLQWDCHQDPPSDDGSPGLRVCTPSYAYGANGSRGNDDLYRHQR